MNHQTRNVPTEPALGIYVNGDAIVDKDLKGQHPLFYGLVRFHGGHQYHAYVKLLPPKQMYAEVLSALVGQHLGLPIPYTSVVVARGSQVGVNTPKVLCLASVATAAKPITRIVRPSEVSHVLNSWANKRISVIFDELIANADRNLRNVLLGADGKLWLIDHEEALGESLKAPHRTICNHLLDRLIEDLGDFERRRSAEMLNVEAVPLNQVDFQTHAANALPSACQVSAEHVRDVVAFLEERVHHIPNLISSGMSLRQSSLGLVR
ncbi:hypothetical protein GQL56_09720 [Pseudomonas putida]|nr:hypothetical protein [Pseudomonas putida]